MASLWDIVGLGEPIVQPRYSLQIVQLAEEYTCNRSICRQELAILGRRLN
ncbi:MAG: hypothetical protein R3C53_01980 [Pirellulaceae bacterium]